MTNSDISRKEREEIGNYFNTFQMYCENDVIERLRRLQNKLANKELMFKFDGNRYAIFSLHIDDKRPLPIINSHWNK